MLVACEICESLRLLLAKLNFSTKAPESQNLKTK